MTTEAHLTQPRDRGKFSHRHSAPGTIRLDGARPLAQALDLSTLPAGESRTLAHDLHGLEGIGSITLTNLGPETSETAHRVAIAVTLPEEANLAELYDVDEWSRRDSRLAAEAAVEEHLGLAAGPGIQPIPGLPADTAAIDTDGNLTVTFHETMNDPAIDPDDLRSWTEPYRDFSNKEFRWRLQEAITERYNER
jgi:hypothetical protein